jgi:hypothetical protein
MSDAMTLLTGRTSVAGPERPAPQAQERVG